MREWYRDIVISLALIAATVQAYFAWRGPSPPDPAVAQMATEHPVGGLILVAGLFLIAGLLNAAPLLRRLLPRKQESTENPDDTDFRQMFLEGKTLEIDIRNN